MRKVAFTAAAGLLLATGLSACGVAKTNTVADTGCKPGNVPTITKGVLTVATDSPAYDPWFSNNDPSNGKGFESAVAYAIGKQMGYSASKVKWVKESFNNSYAPGPKTFDFDVNQISITPERATAVTFSSSYYSTTQAIIALK
ncbi:MAG TPA: transporter substrate-binding domain-containing protein, partial [Marmoricola sp.]|nr:transporter substrate-binding domain-containing protein [Marmoricola sp.]